MTRIAPNPHSPYADADRTVRHIFPSPICFPTPAPGVLALTACEAMAVVPESLVEWEADAPLPDGLCLACVTVMQGGMPPVRESSQCGACGTATWHGELCALCRQGAHEKWWPTRDAAQSVPLSDDRLASIEARAAAATPEDVHALVAEIRRRHGQTSYLFGQLTTRDAETDRGDRALAEFLAAGCDEDENAEQQPAAFVPQTERAYWVDIAAALNAAAAVGMPVGIDLDGTLTDRNAWSVVWDRGAGRWTVAGYDDGEDVEAEQRPDACAACGTAFDPADTRFDGHAKYTATPWCRRCVERCHDNEIADHRCVICA
ncbi:hypothetical protein [Streptomyces sp. NPDC017941]|uniref:hypothetical protein n=1 Tax=Streptomyces sp. NPDC017941 TaxID=3365018 RepID=UPI0037B23E46